MRNQYPIWIVENINKESSYLELVQAVKNLNYNLIELNGDYHNSLLDNINNCPVIFNGSIEMSKIIKDKLKTCYPVCYNSFENFKCSKYYSYFGEYLFNDNYAILSLSELNRNKFKYYGQYGKEALIFIRPNSGEKTFQAQLVDIIDFENFYKQNELIKHDLVLVSTPKKIIGEWRVICSKDKIIDYSLYRYQGQISKIRAIPPEALKLAENLLKIDYKPDDVFCFDICSDSDNNYWLLELTSFSLAGLYASNKENIVKEVNKIILEKYNKK